MELQDTILNLTKSRAVIAEYANKNEKIWQMQYHAKFYNRKRLFNIIAASISAFIIFVQLMGTNPWSSLLTVIYAVPIIFVIVRVGIGDVSDYFKRRILKAQIIPQIYQLAEEMNELAVKLDGITILPEQYRTLQAVDTIGNYLVNKRADSLKEGINLYEDEQFKQKQLDNQHKQIQQNFQMINQNHQMMQQNKEMIRAQKTTNSRLLWI